MYLGLFGVFETTSMKGEILAHIHVFFQFWCQMIHIGLNHRKNINVANKIFWQKHKFLHWDVNKLTLYIELLLLINNNSFIFVADKIN